MSVSEPRVRAHPAPPLRPGAEAPRPGRWGPVRLLLVLGVAFVAAFALQRARSPWLAIETRLRAARDIAARTGLETVDVLALAELHGGVLDPSRLGERAAALARARDELGHVLLAVLATRGRRGLAERLRDEAGDDPSAIEARIRAARAAVEDAVRFAAARERFSARGH